MNPSSRKSFPRIRVSFSLRVLLTTVAVLGISMGWWSTRALQQRRGVSWVHQHGGAVAYDHQMQHPAAGTRGWMQYVDGWWNEDLEAPQNRLRELLGDDYFLTVRQVSFRWYDNAEIVPADLQHLSVFPGLRSLGVDGMGVGEVGVSHISRLTTLTSLALEREDISDADLAQLTKLKNLEALFLRSRRISDDGLKSIARLPKLRMLRINESSITGAGLEHLCGRANLEYLALNQAPLSRTGLTNAQSLGQLKELELKLSGVSNEDVLTLRQALPGCRVVN